MTTVNSKTVSLFSSFTDHIVDSSGCRQTRLLQMSAGMAERFRQSVAYSESQRGENREKQLLVAVKSPLWFAAAVVACWQQRITPIISADLQADTLRELLPSISGAVTDDPLFPIADEDEAVIRVSAESFQLSERDSVDLQENPVFFLENTALVLFTSGSTGEKKRVVKSFAALFEEVANLERMYGATVRTLPRRTTVSHFHIYGFLFNILWPLHAGHPLAAETTFYWEQVLADGAKGACIVSSPAHLRFLSGVAAAADFDFKRSVIFSSGGALDGAIAGDIEAVTGMCPIEVFGSTETGGIAWRIQKRGKPAPFVPFDSVEVRRNDEGGLLVRSHWTGENEQWVETGDRVELFADGTFALNGRYDTVVKIAGKRVSLSEMEAAIGEFSEVVSARVFQVTLDGQNARAALAAVVSMGAAEAVPSAQTKSALVNEFKRRLRGRFDLVTLPRYWRFVVDIPTNSQGKTTLQMLERLVNHDS